MKYLLRHAALTVVFAAAALVPTLVAHAAVPGDLIKIPCPGGEKADHPCRAVYFLGGDGRRHAFPNEHVYFTWYANFNNVKTVSLEEMAAAQLGENVTYRPGSKFVKFLTDPKVYAPAADRTLRWVTSEQIAEATFGANWAKSVDDIPDVFYTDYIFGAAITDAGGYSASAEKTAAPTIDAALPESYRAYKITTDSGTFDIQVVTLRKSRMEMTTDVASSPDCTNGCPTKPLAAYATAINAFIGVHGSYFCPADYADCANKTGTFLPPVFRTADRVMFNAASLRWQEGPMLAYYSDGSYQFTRRAGDLGSVSAMETRQGAQLVAAISNYPALMKEGEVIVNSEPLLDDGQRNNKATRAGIGMNAERIFIVIARNATVPDLAAVFSNIGARDALNLDGGGSTALMFGGAYKIGPGRTLPNAVLFKAK